MPFDLSTAVPVTSGGFDLSTARPVVSPAATPPMNPAADGGTLSIGPFDTGIQTPAWLDNQLAGMGQNLTNTARGIGQNLGLVSRDDIAEDRRLDAPLDATAGGKIGNVGMGIASTLPLLAIPGGATLKGMAAIGGAIGLTQPSASTGETVMNTGLGALAGPALVGGLRIIGGLGRGAYNFAQQFTPEGRDAIAGKTLNRFAGTPAQVADAVTTLNANAKPLVPGVNPSVGMVSGNAGLAQLERSMAMQPEVSQTFSANRQGNANAVLDAVRDIAGTPGAAPTSGAIVPVTPKVPTPVQPGSAGLPVPIQLAADLPTQNGQIVQNMDAIRSRIAPDVTTADPLSLGQNRLDAYKAQDAIAQGDISAKYQALADANGGQFPVDGIAIAQNAEAALKAAGRLRFLPSDVQAFLNDYADGAPMTFNDYENLRTILAAAGRKAERASDGNAAAAINIVRNEVEALPLTGETDALKPLADQARLAARTRFSTIEGDPAYKAAVNDDANIYEPSPLADSFGKKYVINAPAANVGRMLSNLPNDPNAQQEIGAILLDHLKSQAGVDLRTNAGNFAHTGYNRALGAPGFAQKVDMMFDPTSAQQVRQLGDAARVVQTQPRGTTGMPYAAISQPANRAAVGQYLLRDLSPAMNDWRTGEQLNASSFAELMRDADQTAQRATGFPGVTMDQVLSPADLNSLTNVQRTLGQFQDAQKLGMPAGSSTAQNLIAQNAIDAMGATAQLPGLANNGLAKGLGIAMQWAMGANEPAVQMRVAQALLNPADAAALMAKVKPGTTGPQFQRMLENALRIGVQGSTDSAEQNPLQLPFRQHATN